MHADKTHKYLYRNNRPLLILRLKCVYANESQWNRATKYLFRNKWWAIINGGHNMNRQTPFSAGAANTARCIWVQKWNAKNRCLRYRRHHHNNKCRKYHSLEWKFFFGFVYINIEESRNVAVSSSQQKMMYAQFVYAILACMACI